MFRIYAALILDTSLVFAANVNNTANLTDVFKALIAMYKELE